MRKFYYLHHILLISVLFGTTVFLGSCGQQQLRLTRDNALISPLVTQDINQIIIYPDHNPSIPDGKLVWEKMSCAECHLEDGSGVLQADLRNKKYAFNRLPSYQYGFLAFGSKDTPHLTLAGKLTNREIWDLIFYVRSLAAPSLSEKEIAALDPVFGANCAVCHGAQGYGDGPLSHNLVPTPANLHNYERLFDRQDEMLFIHMRNGLPPSAMPAWLNKTDKAKGIKFSEEFLEKKLVSYIRHFHVDNKPSAFRTWEKVEQDEQSKPTGQGKNLDKRLQRSNHKNKDNSFLPVSTGEANTNCCPDGEPAGLSKNRLPELDTNLKEQNKTGMKTPADQDILAPPVIPKAGTSIKQDSFFIDTRTRKPLLKNQ